MFVATLSAIGLLAFPAIAQKVQENVIPGLAGITDIFEIDGTLVAMDDPPVEVNGVVTMIGTGVWDWTSAMSNFGVTIGCGRSVRSYHGERKSASPGRSDQRR